MGSLGNLGLRNAFQLRHGSQGHADVCRFVALARGGREDGTVGLEKKAGQRQPPDELLLLPGTDDRRWNGKEETGFHRGKSAGGFAVERVKLDPARILFQQQRDGVATGRMNRRKISRWTSRSSSSLTFQ